MNAREMLKMNYSECEFKDKQEPEKQRDVPDHLGSL
jgi:hypothetical protein